MIKVRCNSKVCKGRVIGGIDDNGKAFPDYNMKLGNHGSALATIRMRSDGYFGFQCLCGNDSRESAQEKGIVKHNGQPPTRAEMKEIYKRVRNNPSKYVEKKGKTEIDGFSIEGA